MSASNETNAKSSTTHTTGQDNGIEVPPEFLCPISLAVMIHPVTTREGLNFERRAIMSWLENNDTCPLTRKPLKPSDMIPNQLLETKIWYWRETHGILEPAENTEERPFVGFVSLPGEIRNSRAPVTPQTSGRTLSLASLFESDPSNDNQLRRHSERQRRGFCSRILDLALREVDDS